MDEDEDEIYFLDDVSVLYKFTVVCSQFRVIVLREIVINCRRLVLLGLIVSGSYSTSTYY